MRQNILFQHKLAQGLIDQGFNKKKAGPFSDIDVLFQEVLNSLKVMLTGFAQESNAEKQDNIFSAIEVGFDDLIAVLGVAGSGYRSTIDYLNEAKKNFVRGTNLVEGAVKEFQYALRKVEVIYKQERGAEDTI